MPTVRATVATLIEYDDAAASVYDETDARPRSSWWALQDSNLRPPAV